MGNGLSQNEIDALLAGVDENSLTPSMTQDDNRSYKESGDLDGNTKKELEDIRDFLTEAFSSGFGTLGKLTESEVSATTLKPVLKDGDKIINSIKGKTITISQDIKGALNGKMVFIFDEKGVLKLVEKMLGQEETVLSEIALSTLAENFNRFLETSYSWIKNSYKQTVDGDVPKVSIIDNPVNLELPSKQVVEISFTMRLDGTDIPVLLILPVTLTKEIINIVLKGNKDSYSVVEEKSTSREKQINTRPVQFSRLDQHSGKLPFGNIEILLDVSMQVTVELGRTKMRVREILGLGEGSIIELQKLAGEPVDILVNGKLIAKGEVVVIDEYFGVRITEIISPSEMMNLMTVKEEG